MAAGWLLSMTTSSAPGSSLGDGIDKRAVARDGEALDDEFERRFRVAWDLGRYIPSLDHGAPPDISWENLQQYARPFLPWSQSRKGREA